LIVLFGKQWGSPETYIITVEEYSKYKKESFSRRDKPGKNLKLGSGCWPIQRRVIQNCKCRTKNIPLGEKTPGKLLIFFIEN
jgi:hypothetical protein